VEIAGVYRRRKAATFGGNMMKRSCTGVKAGDGRSLQEAGSRSVRRQHDGEIMHGCESRRAQESAKAEGRTVRRKYDGEITRGRGSSCRKVATRLGSIVDPGLLHRHQPRFRKTSNAEEGRRPEGVICGDTRKRVTGFLNSRYLGTRGIDLLLKSEKARKRGIRWSGLVFTATIY
jgi:hypothetical protein